MKSILIYMCAACIITVSCEKDAKEDSSMNLDRTRQDDNASATIMQDDDFDEVSLQARWDNENLIFVRSRQLEYCEEISVTETFPATDDLTIWMVKFRDPSTALVEVAYGRLEVPEEESNVRVRQVIPPDGRKPQALKEKQEVYLAFYWIRSDTLFPSSEVWHIVIPQKGQIAAALLHRRS
jgi:hypothetical protein